MRAKTPRSGRRPRTESRSGRAASKYESIRASASSRPRRPRDRGIAGASWNSQHRDARAAGVLAAACPSLPTHRIAPRASSTTRGGHGRTCLPLRWTRTAALCLLLFGVYAATLGFDAFDDSDYAGDEPHYLLAAESLKRDGDVDVNDEYTARAYAEFYPYDPRQARRGDRRAAERAPRRRLPAASSCPGVRRSAAPTRVELFLARDRRAGGGARLPAGAPGGARPVGDRRGGGGRPQPAVPRLRHGGLPRADRRRRARGRRAARAPARRAAEPQGRVRLLRPARLPPLARHQVRARRARHRLRGRARRSGAPGGARSRSGSVELSLFSVALYVGINEALYGGPTPYAADSPTRRPPTPRSPPATSSAPTAWWRSSSTATYGLLRWAPVFLLAFAGLWWLWRSHRDRLARAVADVREIELTGGLCAAVLAPSCWWPPSSPPPCSASGSRPATCWPRCRWRSRSSRSGLRHMPRLGIALGGADARRAASGSTSTCGFFGGSLVTDRPDAPFGPLTSSSARVRAAATTGRSRSPAAIAGLVASSSCGARTATRARWPAPRARSTPGSARTSGRSCGGGRTIGTSSGLDARTPERQRQHLGVVVVVADAGGGERPRGEGAVAGLAVARSRCSHQQADERARQRGWRACGASSSRRARRGSASRSRSRPVRAPPGSSTVAKSAGSYSPSPSR